MLYDTKWDAKTYDAVGAVLLRAAARLERDGWCQGKMRDGDAHCVLSALYEESRIEQVSHADVDFYFDAARRLDTVVGKDVVIWNDEAGRTKQEVLYALRLAAVR